MSDENPDVKEALSKMTAFRDATRIVDYVDNRDEFLRWMGREGGLARLLALLDEREREIAALKTEQYRLRGIEEGYKIIMPRELEVRHEAASLREENGRLRVVLEFVRRGISEGIIEDCGIRQKSTERACTLDQLVAAVLVTKEKANGN